MSVLFNLLFVISNSQKKYQTGYCDKMTEKEHFRQNINEKKIHYFCFYKQKQIKYTLCIIQK
ncbi:hypothetical protein CW731_06965 [Polaribacter sp. ALD11]|nr:hypothetical protein CW731_06965 [Polaribacter sp. ALD11]